MLYFLMGVKNIMVSGKNKAEAVKNSLFGPITPAVPASIFQLHNDVTIVADEVALSEIS